jgi:hypothetical protein
VFEILIPNSVEDFTLRRSIILFHSYIICVVYFMSHLGDPGVDGRIVLRWIFRKWDMGLWTGSSWLRVGTVGEHL